ncbi:YceI family protein [Ramlibacter sp.]|uniref:YceI family protein n=1 Tax=Ramlibacter sp. TaxID=1917967 RepID=UPI003D0F8A37
MKRLTTLLLAMLASMPLLAAPVTYNIDPFHSYPNFTVNHLGMTTIHGRFDRMTGKVVLDTAAKTGSLEVRIQTATVNTGDARRTDGARSRDEHLRNADFFNSSEFPEMIYRSTKLNFAGDKVDSVEGTLTMIGVTRPVTLKVTSFNCGPHPFNKRAMCGAYVEGAIKRTDFGMKFGVPGVSDEVKLMIGLEAYQE